ncbi:DUF2971 domain-containing protein [Streptococcus salivarius]|uniref:DUF2971 domain-containing protein n=1 Tax=Streptococcus salivarius TaxID=1304 RepID=UPI001605493C|nr:DUF2971 domain-containing protein [Streptococcus salivarius]
MDEQKYNLDQSLAELNKLLNLSANATDKASRETLAEKAKIIYEQFPESEEIALRYARILVNLSAKQENVEERWNTANSVKEIVDRFNHSEDIALRYAKALVNLSTKQTELKEIEATAEKLETLQQKFQKSPDIALQYAWILVNLSTKQTKLKDLVTTAEKLENLQQKFQDSHDIAEALARILVNLSIKQTKLKEIEATAEKLETLQQKFPESPDIALLYAMILVNLSTKQTKLKELVTTAEKLENLQQKLPESPDIAEVLASFLFNLSIKQTELKEIEATAEKLENLQQKLPESPDIAEALARFLFNLSIKQTELKEIEATAEKLENLQQKFPESPDIALPYAMILVNLSAEQTVLKEIEATAKKLEKLQKKFQDSPDIALQYAMILFNLSTKQTELKELETTAEKLQVVQQQFQESEEIAFIYSMVLASLFEHQTESSERRQTTKTIKKRYKEFSKFMIQKFDDLFFSNENVCDSEEYMLFNFILREGLLNNTKYAILQTWTERYKEDSSELKNLLSIYQLVQKIKYQLGLKDENKNQVLKFGHYTKGSTLQIMLNQEGNDKKDFSVSGKTRLYNANYMNDPEEGIVIEQILGLDRRDILEPSSWFLMSFTNKTDDLAMWSQYGDDAKGVCLVLREDDFSRFTSFNDVSWRKEAIPLVETMSKLESTLSYDLKGSPNELNNIKSTVAIKGEEKRSKSEKKENVPKGNRDYLYRIAYVKNIGEDIELEQTELFDKAEIENLAKMLKSLKEKLGSGSKVTKGNYQDAIAECIEEIRYLFKSVDYKYENELRILHYANLDPSNKEIKIDKTSGVGKLYIERENPIQIEEVIFGPKFQNPEYVTPLLKLLDKDINYKKSTIKFR